MNERWKEGDLEVIRQEADGQFWILLEDGHYSFQANFCPLTGIQAPRAIEAPERTVIEPNVGNIHRAIWKQDQLEVCCIQQGNGEFWVGVEDGHYNFQANFCPLTGVRAPRQRP